ncbi:MAG: hypothetical protein EOP11_01825 [Proteobacteria bacterium]|nr:MAG: hypothetical protein EOP11_01825 [Pseudomonadota bacterium]
MKLQEKRKKLIPGAAAYGLAGALLFSSPLLAADNVQVNSYINTDAKNRTGSDQSMQSSSTFAMSALMDLASFKIPAAVNNGMTAYGKYRNSETLDKLGDMNQANAASMASVGNGTGAGKLVKTQTSFRRIGTSFMKEGPAAEVAKEFEKRSGMSREKFMQHLSAVSEKKISRNDPQLVDKVLTRFEGFIADVPNAEFKGNLQKAVNMVPATVRTGLIGKAVAKFASVVSASNANTAPVSDISAADLASAGSANAPKPDAAEGKAAEATLAGASAAADANNRAVATDANQVPALGTSLAEVPGSRKGEDDANPLGNIVQAAITSQGQAKDVTIFQQVSRVYKNMAGFFSGPSR